MIPKILKVMEPCNESWDNMTPVEQGKFCNHCQKKVVDFSQMSPVEISDFLQKHTGSLCGRLSSQNTFYLEKPQINSKDSAYVGLPGRKISVGILLSTGLLFCTPTTIAQNNAPIELSTCISIGVPEKRVEKKKNQNSLADIVIKGKVSVRIGNKEFNVAEAKVSLLTKDKEYFVYSDTNGNFQLSVPSEAIKDKNVMYFSFDKYELQELNESDRDLVTQGARLEDGYQIFSKKELIDNAISYSTEIEALIMGMMAFFDETKNFYLKDGILYNEKQFTEIEDAQMQNQSCNTNMNTMYFLQGEGADIVAEKDINGNLMVFYNDEIELDDETVF